MGTLVHHNFGHPAPLLTKKQIARHLGRTTRWVEKQVAAGMPSQIEPFDGRMQRLFPLYDVEAFLAGDRKGEADAKARQAVRSS